MCASHGIVVVMSPTTMTTKNARARIDDVNDDGKAIFGLAQFRSLINFTVVVALFHRTLSSTVLIVICLLLPLSSFFRRRSLNYPRARRTTTKQGRLDYIYWSFQLKEEWVELARLAGVSCNFVPIILIFIIVLWLNAMCTWLEKPIKMLRSLSERKCN